MSQTLSNWAGNFTYSTANLHEPATVEETQTLVAKLPKLRTLGTRHCFNDIADSTENLVSLQKLNKVVGLDRSARSVTVEGGVTYGQLCPLLEKEGFALTNLASLPHISVAGAIATATHGSGEKVGNLATQVSALEIINASGELVSLSREADGDQFLGAVVALGGLGPVVRLTLDVVPSYQVAQTVYEVLPFDALEDDLDAIEASGYSVSLFTDWKSESFNQVWVKRVAPAESPRELFGAKAATTKLHPVPGMPSDNCTEQLGVAGPWNDRLPHFRLEFTPSAGEELQTEYFVRREDTVAALKAILPLRPQIAENVFITEVRTVAADNLWMSPCYRQDRVAIHFTWHQNWPAVQAILPQIEAALDPFNPVPHWGKLFKLSPEKLQSRYARLPDFRQLLDEFDPTGKFRNAYLERNLF